MAAEFTSFASPWRGGTMHDDLWRYACELYARPGVATACLAAQAQGSNVCLLLCALWLEDRGVAWEAARAGALEAIAEPWAAKVVTPLRTLRQQWREGEGDAALAALREVLKRLELEAEQVLLTRLQQAALPWPAAARAQSRWLGWAVKDPAAVEALRAAIANP